MDDKQPDERTDGLTWGLRQLHQALCLITLPVIPSPGMRQELAAARPEQPIMFLNLPGFLPE
ncbi:hypothetical protein [Sulfobacillus thermosulfidooxidans]|uniref:hypothetical protein n=1 Tax=Sulfobacillus thermosulfidooxidans TaxID=28034 RepID=UPI000B1F4ECE|nr:hypothetical protein [Sulfobacillus thermosulfidooxidans]